MIFLAFLSGEYLKKAEQLRKAGMAGRVMEAKFLNNRFGKRRNCFEV